MNEKNDSLESEPIKNKFQDKDNKWKYNIYGTQRQFIIKQKMTRQIFQQSVIKMQEKEEQITINSSLEN